jgi:uncharacterized Fe-S cluster-containing radical SAM superfamily protein
MPVDTDRLSERYRAAMMDSASRRILITRIAGSQQEPDVTEPLICRGFGRIRHFRRRTSKGWPQNPLPIDPAARALALGSEIDEMRAAVFQNAACNWRCWYCFVPFELLSADPKKSGWLSASELVEMYVTEPNRPAVLDLSGGQPELTPEWVLWVMEELLARGLQESVYVWSDDNLSNDYFWRYLSASEQEFITSYPKYGRVGCFKGFDEQSFAYNTGASGELFQRQFELMKRYLSSGIDIYAYVTFPTPDSTDIADKVRRFIDRLQAVHPHLPLRTIPLEVALFSPVFSRLNGRHSLALQNQWLAAEVWEKELTARFSMELLGRQIVDVPLGDHAQSAVVNS